jgi:endoglycosylceramidase
MKSIAIALMAAFTAAQTAPIHIDPEMRMLVDSEGRPTIFHGVNVVYKIDPYIPSNGDFDPQNSLNIKDIADLKKWGMNFVRLGVMWEAVERSAGIYDDNYLDKVEILIN